MKHNIQVILNIIFINTSSLFFWIPIRWIRTFYLRMFLKNMGKNVYVGRNIDIRQPASISIGDNVVINKRALLDGRGGLTISHDVDIAQDVNIWTQQHDYNSADHRTVNKPVYIGHHSWICARSVILPGVTVAPGTILATCAVLTKNTEEKSVMCGIPACKTKLRDNSLEYNLIYNPRFFE